MADMSLPIDTTGDQPDDEPVFASLDEAAECLDGAFGDVGDKHYEPVLMALATACELAERLDPEERLSDVLQWTVEQGHAAAKLYADWIDSYAAAWLVYKTNDPAQLSAPEIRRRRHARLTSGPTVAEHEAVERFKGRVAELQPDEADAAAWDRLKARIAELHA